MAKKTSHHPQSTALVAAYVAALQDISVKGTAFDSAAATDFVSQSLDGNGVATPETLKAVFAESDEKQVKMITRAILDSAKNYREQHGFDAPADLLEHAMHMAYTTTKIALDSSADSGHHAQLSLQPNRAVVAIMSAMSEAIPFAHYLPADINSNEAKLAIMSHQAGNEFGGYAKGALMDGVSSGDRYISTSREHKCTILADDITGKITATQLTDETCDPSGAEVPLLRGRSIVYVNGAVAAREVSAGGTGPSNVARLSLRALFTRSAVLSMLIPVLSH